MAVWRHCNNVILPAMPPTFIIHPPANSTNETVASSLIFPSTSIQSQSSMPKNLKANFPASIDQSYSHPTIRKQNSKLPPGAKDIWKTSSQTQQLGFNNKKKMGTKMKAMKESASLYD